ncbi:MAG: copper amine oxidase N-terminal domain-containing protein [Syntrophomonas sp.]
MRLLKPLLLIPVLLAALVLAGTGPASAASTNQALSTPTVTVGNGQILGTIEILESAPGSFAPGMEIMVILPADFRYSSAPTPASSGNYVFIPANAGSGVNALAGGDVAVAPISTDLVLILNVVHISNPGNRACIHILYNVSGYSQVNVDDDEESERQIQIIDPSGAVSSGHVVNSSSYGRTSSKVLEAPNCSPGNGITLGTIKLEENRPGALLAFEHSVSLTLPWGVTWTEAELKLSGGFLDGDVAIGTIDKDEDGNSRLWLDIKNISWDWSGPNPPPHITNNEPGVIEIKGKVNIAPAVSKGDVKVRVGGSNPGITSNFIVAAKNVGQAPAPVTEPQAEDKPTAKTEAKFIIGVARYSIDNIEQTMEVAPYINNGRTYLPLYYAARALGIEDHNIQWDGITQTITLIKEEKTARLTIGKPTMILNQESVNLEAAPEISDGRTCLPIGLIARFFGKTVYWDSANYTVTIA